MLADNCRYDLHPDSFGCKLIEDKTQGHALLHSEL